jgi:hypothetical protein
MFNACLMAVYTMIKGKIEMSGEGAQKVAKWDTINLYKIIAKIMNLLSYGHF